MFLGIGVLKICSKFTGEQPRWSVISIKILCNSIEIAVWHECAPVNLLHIFRIPFLKNTSEGLLLKKTVFGYYYLFCQSKIQNHNLNCYLFQPIKTQEKCQKIIKRFPFSINVIFNNKKNFNWYNGYKFFFNLNSFFLIFSLKVPFPNTCEFDSKRCKYTTKAVLVYWNKGRS